MLPARAEPRLPQRLEGARLDDLGREGVEGAARLPPAEEPHEVRAARLEAQGLERAAGLLGNGLGRVPLADPAGRPRHVEHGHVRDGRPVGEASPLEIGDAAVRQAVAELEQEPGLADAGLPDDPDGLSPPSATVAKRSCRVRALGRGRRSG